MGILKSFGKTAEDLMDEADKVLAEPDLPISKVSKVEDESHVEPKTDADTDSDLPDPDVPNTATVRDPEPSTRRDDLDGPSAEDGADVTTITPKKRKKKKKEKKKGKQQFAPASDIDRHLKQYSADDVRDMTSLHKSMTKVTLSTSRWTAKIKDPRIAKAAADAGHANAESFDGRKSLVAGAEQEVKKINSLIDKAKTSHYRLTLPWSTVSGKDDGRRQGPRVMPNLRYFEYVEEMAKHASAVKEAIDEFAPKYEQIKEIARENLGEYYDEGDYPSIDAIKDRFGIKFFFEPLPDSEKFKGAHLPPGQAEALADRLNSQMADMLNNALHDLWNKLYKQIMHMVERLSDPNNTFHHTLVGNVEHLADMLKACNIDNDPDLDQLYKEIKSRLATVEAKDLRKDEKVRKAVAKDAKEIAAKMRELGYA